MNGYDFVSSPLSFISSYNDDNLADIYLKQVCVLTN